MLYSDNKYGVFCWQHCGVDPADVDILMGTFTKSFGGMGGYIASSKEFVEALKRQSSGSMFSTAMSPIICKQIIRAFDIIDGTCSKCPNLDSFTGCSRHHMPIRAIFRSRHGYSW